MVKTCLALFVFAFTLNASAAGFNEFYKTKIKSGDGIITLFDRYELERTSCNLQKFYELNDLTKGAALYSHKTYFLPIKVYKYNGKSIRTTLKIEDLELAKEIQTYNETLAKKGLKKKTYERNSPLWVPIHTMGCEETSPAPKTEKSEVKSKLVVDKKECVKNSSEKENKKDDVTKDTWTTNHSLFGPKYENVNMFDNQLKGQVFYVSSGHGGPDPGAQCSDLDHTLCEDEYAYDVALRLARDLTQHGATVHMVIQDENDGIRDDAFLDCDYDEICMNGKDLPLRQLDRLKQRADAINKLYAKYKKQGVKKQTAIMIHVDSQNKEHSQDVFFYHYGKDKTSKELAYNLESTFEEKYDTHQKGRGYRGYVKNRGLYMLRKVNPSAVYVELANIRNKSDHIRLMESYNRQALANWLFEGLTGIQ